MQGTFRMKDDTKSTLDILVSFHSQFESYVSYLHLSKKLPCFMNKNFQRQKKSQIKWW